MLIRYGCVNLNLLHVRSYERTALYEHANYIGTKYRLVVQAIYNPGTQSDSWPFSPTYKNGSRLDVPYVPNTTNNPFGPVVPAGPPQFSPPLNTPPVRQGVPGVVSDIALRHALMQPRQQLSFSIGGLINLYSPLPGFQTDVIGGPTPIYCNVQEVQGTRTWVVDYCIETVINECPLYAGMVPALLSNVWVMRHELDEDYFCKQTIIGRATFRMDALVRMGNQPDNYRGLFILPPMPGFKRERIEVNVGNPPNVVEYRLTDRQLPLGWNIPGITRVKASHTVHTRKETGDTAAMRGLSRVAKDIAEAVYKIGANFGRMGAGDVPAKSEAEAGTGITLDVVGVGASLFSESVNFAMETLPTNQHRVSVEVHGDATTTRNALEAYARGLVAWRLAFIDAILTRPGTALTRLMEQAGLGLSWQSIYNAASGALGNLPNAIGANGGGIVSGLAGGAVASGPGVISGIAGGGVEKLLNYWIGVGNSLFAGYDVSVTHDLAGKAVAVEYTLTTGPLLSILGKVSPTMTLAAQGLFPATDDSGPYIFVGGTPGGPPGDGVSRGSYIGQCVAAAFQASCELPRYPYLLPGPDNVTGQTPPFLLPPSSPYLIR